MRRFQRIISSFRRPARVNPLPGFIPIAQPTPESINQERLERLYRQRTRAMLWRTSTRIPELARINRLIVEHLRLYGDTTQRYTRPPPYARMIDEFVPVARTVRNPEEDADIPTAPYAR